jgi:hypothetical protein
MWQTELPETLPPEKTAVLRAAFWHLLDHGEPVPASMLVDATGMDAGRLRDELDALVRVGRVRMTGDGEVHGALGLTITPTTHEISFAEVAGNGEPGKTRFTWCALDALGIVNALNATAELRSICPATGVPIEIGFREGLPGTGAVTSVLFSPPYQRGTPVVDLWCPLVNLFKDGETARAWAMEKGVSGDCVPLAEATAHAGTMWRARIGPEHDRT